MRPEQVIDMQFDLDQRLAEDPLFRTYIAGVFQAPMTSSVDPIDVRNGQAMLGGLGAYVHRALAYRVTADMSMLVEHTSLMLDDSDLFSADLAPSREGIVFFERPLPMYDVRGKRMLIHWLVWGPTQMADERGRPRGTGTAAYYFNDQLIEPDDIGKTDIAQSAMKVFGRWGFIGGGAFRAGEKMGPALIAPGEAYANQIRAEGDTPERYSNVMRYVHALWLLFGQTITSVEPEYVARKSAKRAGQAGLPGRVSVVQLRRTEGRRSEGESLIQWSHRWLVRSHLRWQPYGPLRGDHEHVWGSVEVYQGHSTRFCVTPGCENRIERIVIPPAVKGPADKPIVVTQHVYNMAR